MIGTVPNSIGMTVGYNFDANRGSEIYVVTCDGQITRRRLTDNNGDWQVDDEGLPLTALAALGST